jgi:hypothetical protein
VPFLGINIYFAPVTIICKRLSPMKKQLRDGKNGIYLPKNMKNNSLKRKKWKEGF